MCDLYSVKTGRVALPANSTSATIEREPAIVEKHHYYEPHHVGRYVEPDVYYRPRHVYYATLPHRFHHRHDYRRHYHHSIRIVTIEVRSQSVVIIANCSQPRLYRPSTPR